MRFFALVSALLFLCCAQPRSTLASAGAEEVIDTTKSAVNERPDASRPSATSNVTPLRCGWFDNPTPGNFWLVDRDGSWEVGVQGGYQAKGLDRIPDFGTHWQITNAGSHGYGCACLRAKVDVPHGRVLTIEHLSVLSLRQCRRDAHLNQTYR